MTRDRFPHHYETDACRERVHERCSGSERDGGDGTWAVCECVCHEEARDAHS